MDPFGSRSFFCLRGNEVSKTIDQRGRRRKSVGAVDGGRAGIDSSGARAHAAPVPRGHAARGGRAAIKAGGRARKNYLNERAAGAARHDVDPVDLGVARERLRGSGRWPDVARSYGGPRGGARRRRGDLRWSGPRPCPRPGLRCWAPAPPGRCSRSSRRAPRSCGCPRPSPWCLRRACDDDGRRRSFCALRFF